MPTPAGVPVEITSPICSARPADRVAINCGMVKIRSRVLSLPQLSIHMAGDVQGSAIHLIRRHTIDDRIAPDMTHRITFSSVAPRLADVDAQFRLMVHRIHHGGTQVHHRVLPHDRTGRFGEDGVAIVHRLAFAGTRLEPAGQKLAGVFAVILAHAKDAALENVEAIAAVPRLDVLLVVTNDLSNSMGLFGQLDHPHVIAGYERVAAACKAHGKHLGVGGLVSRPDLARSLFIRLGATYATAGSDAAFLLNGSTAACMAFR